MSPTDKVTQYMNEHDVVPRVEEAINKAVLKKSTNPLAEVGLALLAGDSAPEVPRPLSLPKQVAKAGGVSAWNAQPSIAQQIKMLDAACTATTVGEALLEARGTHLALTRTVTPTTIITATTTLVFTRTYALTST
jgi:hypothetical protein